MPQRPFPGGAGAPRTYEFGDLRVDLNCYRVIRSARPVDLGPTEFRLLCILIDRPDHVFTRRELVERLWPNGGIDNVRNVDVHVGRLRRAINAKGKLPLIRTVRTVGYSLH